MSPPVQVAFSPAVPVTPNRRRRSSSSRGAFPTVTCNISQALPVIALTRNVVHSTSAVHEGEKIQERGFMEGRHDSCSLIYEEAEWRESDPAAGPSCDPCGPPSPLTLLGCR